MNITTLQMTDGKQLRVAVFKTEHFNPADPIITVADLSEFGKAPTSHHVHIHDVDLNNVTFLELLAMDYYFELNGEPSGLLIPYQTRVLALHNDTPYP